MTWILRLGLVVACWKVLSGSLLVVAKISLPVVRRIPIFRTLVEPAIGHLLRHGGRKRQGSRLGGGRQGAMGAYTCSGKQQWQDHEGEARWREEVAFAGRLLVEMSKTGYPCFTTSFGD